MYKDKASHLTAWDSTPHLPVTPEEGRTWHHVVATIERSDDIPRGRFVDASYKDRSMDDGHMVFSTKLKPSG